MYQYVQICITICNQSTQLKDETICTNMYQYVSQYVINLHNLRMKHYVPRCITICNQSTQLKDKTICTNMYHNMYSIYITS